MVLENDSVMWLATAHGLGRLDLKKLDFRLYTRQDGLQETELMGIAIDDSGILWLKGLSQIIQYRPETDEFYHFNTAQDIQGFNTIGTETGPEGLMLFHGNNGLYAFHPDQIPTG